MDLTLYVGQTIRIKLLVHQDRFGTLTGMFVDDVQLTLWCGRRRLRLRASTYTHPKATPDAEAATVTRPLHLVSASVSDLFL